MKERVEFLEEIQFSHDELERESEMFVRELESELNGYKHRHKELMVSYSKLQIELDNAHQTIFQFKNHIQKLEDTKQRMSSMHDRMSMSKKEKEMEKEAIMRENIELVEKLDNLQSELIHNSMIAAQGFSHSVKSILIESHFPKQINYDRNCIDLLSLLERYNFKVRFTKEFLDSFYINGVRLSMTRDKEKQLESIHELCPILLRHDRYVEAIERALISSFVETFDKAITQWKALQSIEQHYDNILHQCKENNVDGTVAVHQLIACNEIFRTFLRDNFATYDPDQPRRAHDKVDKWIVNESFGKLYYDLKLFALKLRSIRHLIADLSEPDHKNIVKQSSVVNKIEESNDNPDNTENVESNIGDGTDQDQVTTQRELEEEENPGPVPVAVPIEEPPTSAGERHVVFDILQKMDQLQQTIFGITQNVLEFALPTRCSFFGSRTNLKQCM